MTQFVYVLSYILGVAPSQYQRIEMPYQTCNVIVVVIGILTTPNIYMGVSLNDGTPKWSILVGKPMVVGYHHFRKPPYL